MSSPKAQDGYTIVELLIVMVITAVFATMFFTFFKTSLFSYFDLQRSATSSTSLAIQSQRMASIVRGTVEIEAADSNDLSVYTYYSPKDTTPSLVRYYYDGANEALQADVTPLTDELPTGTPISSQKRTFTVLSPFYQPDSLTVFKYYDASYTAVATPVSNLTSIQLIRINLAVDSLTKTANNAMSLVIDLRNRKVNI